ncbi:MAG: phytoene/squalene synthase family protein [Planctomycetota bacterium]
MNDSSEVSKSYAWCRDVCRRSKSNFYASFRLLAPERRRAMDALYAFARISDDLADAIGLAEDKQLVLEAWRERLGQIDSGKSLSDSSEQLLEPYRDLWPGLADAVVRFQIPLGLLDDIVEGVSMDLASERRFTTWAELDQYCYYVASAVGLACTYIWKADQEVPRETAVVCGQAFQLTNILRDVQEDAASGRIYLPLDSLRQYGVGEANWLGGQPNGDWTGLVESVARTAFERYEQGWDTIEYLTPDSQRMFSLMWRSYRQLLEEVIRHKEELWTGQRIRVGTWQKTRLLLRHVLPMVSFPKSLPARPAWLELKQAAR